MRESGVMAPDRISLAAGSDGAPDDPGTVRAAPSRSADRMRDLLPAIEPERRITDWGRSDRLHAVVRGNESPYRYEKEVEEFLRWSPHVRRERKHDKPFGL